VLFAAPTADRAQSPLSMGAKYSGQRGDTSPSVFQHGWRPISYFKHSFYTCRCAVPIGACRSALVGSSVHLDLRLANLVVAAPATRRAGGVNPSCDVIGRRDVPCPKRCSHRAALPARPAVAPDWARNEPFSNGQRLFSERAECISGQRNDLAEVQVAGIGRRSKIDLQRMPLPGPHLHRPNHRRQDVLVFDGHAICQRQMPTIHIQPQQVVLRPVGRQQNMVDAGTVEHLFPVAVGKHAEVMHHHVAVFERCSLFFGVQTGHRSVGPSRKPQPCRKFPFGSIAFVNGLLPSDSTPPHVNANIRPAFYVLRLVQLRLQLIGQRLDLARFEAEKKHLGRRWLAGFCRKRIGCSGQPSHPRHRQDQQQAHAFLFHEVDASTNASSLRTDYYERLFSCPAHWRQTPIILFCVHLDCG